jgi:hypothetical protein
MPICWSIVGAGAGVVGRRMSGEPTGDTGGRTDADGEAADPKRLEWLQPAAAQTAGVAWRRQTWSSEQAPRDGTTGDSPSKNIRRLRIYP